MSIAKTKEAPIQKPTTEVMAQAPSLIKEFADRYKVAPEHVLDSLKKTCFRSKDKNGGEVTTAQLVMLLIVANEYKLNPFLREIYAFPSDGGIVPIVGVDGWLRIVNQHPAFDGMSFEYGQEMQLKDDRDNFKGIAHEYVDCLIHRKDRDHPIVVREYYIECVRGSGPWKEMPRRMLRHKALIQCARYAFGFAGIYDEDDGEVIAAGGLKFTPDNNDVEKLPSGRVHHRREVKPVDHQEQSKESSSVVEEQPVETPALSEEQEIKRQELIDHLDNELTRDDIAIPVLENLGKVISKHADLFGASEHQRLHQAWVARCKTGEVSAPSPKKNLF